MKKLANISLSILLSVMILWIGSGIMVMVCEHTGNVSVAKTETKRHCNESKADHCMKYNVKTLSPTNTAQSSFFKLQPLQLSLLPQMVSCNQLLPLPVLTKAPERVLSLLWHSPPRQYLRILTTLLIWFLDVSVAHRIGRQRILLTCISSDYRC